MQVYRGSGLKVVFQVSLLSTGSFGGRMRKLEQQKREEGIQSLISTEEEDARIMHVLKIAVDAVVEFEDHQVLFFWAGE